MPREQAAVSKGRRQQREQVLHNTLITVAILAQGTSWAVAVTQAFFAHESISASIALLANGTCAWSTCRPNWGELVRRGHDVLLIGLVSPSYLRF